MSSMSELNWLTNDRSLDASGVRERIQSEMSASCLLFLSAITSRLDGGCRLERWHILISHHGRKKASHKRFGASIH